MDETNGLIPIEEKKQTKKRSIISFLRENPDIPDMLRDFAPYLPERNRNILLKAAGFAEALNSVDPAKIKVYNENVPDKEELYSVMMKYMPLDKREAIDGLKTYAESMRSRMTPLSATNKIERMINSLSRINELSKIAGGAKALREVSRIEGNVRNDTGKAPDMDSMLNIIGAFAGQDKVKKLKEMLSGTGFMKAE